MCVHSHRLFFVGSSDSPLPLNIAGLAFLEPGLGADTLAGSRLKSQLAALAIASFGRLRLWQGEPGPKYPTALYQPKLQSRSQTAIEPVTENKRRSQLGDLGESSSASDFLVTVWT